MIRNTSATDRPIARTPGWGRRRAAGAGLVVAVVVALSTFAVQGARQQWSGSAVPAASVRFATVERGDLVRDTTVQGRIVAAVRPTLFAPAAGVAALHVEAGERVERHQLLVQLDSPELASALEQEHTTLDSLALAVERARLEAQTRTLELRKLTDQARVHLVAAQREYDRARHGRSLQIISDFDYREAADELERARIELKHAEADTELGRQRLDFEVRGAELQLARQSALVADLSRQVKALSLRSPAAGIVGDLQVEHGSAVLRHQALLSVIDLSALAAELLVPESYAREVAAGMPAEIGIGAQTARATVVAVSPEVRDGHVAVQARFDGAVPDTARQNQRVSARLLLDLRPDVVKVRRGQFMESGGGRVAYVREGDVLLRRSVHLVPGSLREVEVLEGLEPGEHVALDHLERFDGAERVLLTR